MFLFTSNPIRKSLFLFTLILQFLPSQAKSAELVLENFEPTSESKNWVGAAPQGWELGNEIEGKRDYFLFSENALNFLRAKFIPGTKGKVIFKKIEWNISEYPILSWKWRVLSWAEGSSVKDSKKEDSAASVYVSLKVGIKNYVMKYIWTNADELGKGYSKGRWSPTGALEARVNRVGGKLGEWVVENRNIAEDFKLLYKKDPPTQKATGIGILTEGDGTLTEPSADYDDFVARTLASQ